MKPYTVVSFATSGTPYVTEMIRLIQSLEKFDIPFLTRTLPSRGEWVRNCSMKGEFLLWARDAIEGPIVWLDADAEVMDDPSLFQELDCDIAYRIRRWALSGTVYLGDTDAARRLLAEWVRRSKLHPRVWDQKVMGRTTRSMSDVRFTPLPPEYTTISGTDRHVVKSPVIFHHQASRRLKSEVRSPVRG